MYLAANVGALTDVLQSFIYSLISRDFSRFAQRVGKAKKNTMCLLSSHYKWHRNCFTIFLDDVCKSPFKTIWSNSTLIDLSDNTVGGNSCYVPICQFSEAGLHGSIVWEIHCISSVLIPFPFPLHLPLFKMKVVCIISRKFFLWTFTALPSIHFLWMHNQS